MNAVSLVAFGRGVFVECEDEETRDLVLTLLGGLEGRPADVALRYRARRSDRGGYRFSREGRGTVSHPDGGEFLALLDEDLTLEMERLRPELLFLHAAALELAGRALLLVAGPGKGKSTTCWALLHHGFGYLSDELAPVGLESLAVQPYPHAVCLKRDPPAPYPLPGETHRASRLIHVPATSVPSRIVREPAPLAGIFFTEYRPETSGPEATRISPARAGARLYAQTLNALAHPGEGLDAAMELVSRVPCFELVAASLPATCRLVKATAESLLEATPAPGARGWPSPPP